MAATLALAGWLAGIRASAHGGDGWRSIWPPGLVVPWIPRYLDHPPEFLSGPLPFRFLLGTPIGFIGGNFATMARWCC